MLLAVVVLWTAVPMFACVVGACRHSCCQGMMHDCGSPASMAQSDCCVAQHAPDPVLPGKVAVVDSSASLGAIPALVEIIALPQFTGSQNSGSADSPPQCAAAVSSILRI